MSWFIYSINSIRISFAGDTSFLPQPAKTLKQTTGTHPGLWVMQTPLSASLHRDHAGSDWDIFTSTAVQRDYREGGIIWGCNHTLLRDVPWQLLLLKCIAVQPGNNVVIFQGKRHVSVLLITLPVRQFQSLIIPLPFYLAGSDSFTSWDHVSNDNNLLSGGFQALGTAV